MVSIIISGITRRGWTGTAFGAIDQLVYNYDGNMLNTITENSLITRGFKKVSAGASG